MSRLPIVGSDSNAWGTVLNDFLGVSHNADGSLKNLFINVKDPAYGAKGDGTTDDTAAIAAALGAANSAGGGTVFFPAGTYLTGNQTLYNNVHLKGAGVIVTTIKLKNGANADLFSALTGSINLSAAYGTGSNTASTGWGIYDMTLDGNKANNSGTSWCMRFYGYGYYLQNVVIQNGFSGGILSDYNGTANPAGNTSNSKWNNVQVHDCSGVGIQIGGPSDTHWSMVDSFHNTHCYHIAPNAGGLQAANCHGWGPATGSNKVCWLVETQIIAVDCEAEGSDTAQCVFLSDRIVWSGGRIFAGSQPGAGIQIGQTAGNTPYTGEIAQSAGVTTAVGIQNYLIQTIIDDITSTNGALWFANDLGGTIIAQISQSSGVYQSAAMSNSGTAMINSKGLTADGSLGKSGYQQFISNAFQGFLVGKPGTNWLNVDTFDGVIQAINGASFIGYSDAGSTITWRLQGGTLSTAQSATAPALATSGTITTSGVGVARVAPTGAVTGIILQAGTLSGQQIIVVNESVAANSITFNTTPATSNIADSATEPAIAGLTARKFVWDSSTSRWYRMA